MTIKELLEKAQNKELHVHVWNEVLDKMAGFIDEVKLQHTDLFKKLDNSLTDLICYTPLSMEEAEKFVSGMKNNDGTAGAHWRKDEVCTMISSYPELKKFPFADVYACLNMVWSDNWDGSYTEGQAVKDAVHFLDDKDAPKNKMYRYIKAMQ